MATTALAQEKIWFDKPSYDKAERLHFERLAKLGMCCKVITNNVERYSSLTDSNDPVSPNPQDSVDSCFATKSKCKKTRSNKSLVQDNGLNDVSKCSKSHGKKAEESSVEKAEMNEILDTAYARFKDIAPLVYGENRCKPKEIKEKKKKSDKKHRSEEVEKIQLPSQGNQESTCPIFPASGSLANEVAKARQHIKQSLQCMDGIAALSSAPNQEVVSRIDSLEKEVQDLKKTVQELKSIIGLLEGQVKHQRQGSQTVPEPYIAVCPAKPTATPAKDEDDVDLFGSDSEGEDAEAAKIREQRLAAYNAKKSKKPALIAKSNIILDVKPWDDETDMKVMEAEVRKIETDGLLWGAAKLVPLAYGIQKLQISCVVEDEKVSVDWLTEQIEAIEDYVQSVDIAAFNKV